MITIRPAGRVRRCSKTRGSGRVGAGGDRNVMGQLGSGRGQEVIEIMGHLGSDQEGFKSHGSGQATLLRSDWYTETSSDPRKALDITDE